MRFWNLMRCHLDLVDRYCSNYPSSHSRDTFEAINMHSLHKHPQTHLFPDLAHARWLARRLFKHGYSDVCVSNSSSWLPRSSFTPILLYTYNSSRRSMMVVVLGGRVAYYPHPKHPKGRKRCDTEEEKVTMAPRRRHDTPVAPPNPISTIILRSKVKLIKSKKKHRSES